jgi:UMF1 family MFS transporter
MAALLPPYFMRGGRRGLPKAQASSIWGYSVSIAMFLVALMGPILGAIADHSGSKKTLHGHIRGHGGDFY